MVYLTYNVKLDLCIKKTDMACNRLYQNTFDIIIVDDLVKDKLENVQSSK